MSPYHFFTAFCLLLWHSPGAIAQTAPPPATPAPASQTAEEKSVESSRARLLVLRDRYDARQKVEIEIESLRKKLAARPAPLPEQVAAMEEELKKWVDQRDQAEAEFLREASGVNDNPISTDGDISLEDQARQVVKPALDALASMMKQPREINELERSITSRYQTMPQVKKSIQGIEATLGEVTAAIKLTPDDKQLPELRTKLNTKLDEGRKRLRLLESEITTLQQRLDGVKSGRESLGEVFSRLWSSYVLQRLLNLVLAALAFTGVLFILRWLHRLIGKRNLRKRLGMPIFLGRTVDVLYYLLSTLTALGAAFLVLYLAGDWLLLTLGMLLVAGLALLSRHSLPRLYEQARVMLNLGAIREGERVVWMGLPWLVRRLHVTCELHNPHLTGGTVLLPLRDVDNLISRVPGPNERWFPSHEGDWVELSDGMFGKVVLQTPEMVQILPLGGSFRTYSVMDYLRLNPRNLSYNFRVSTLFGIDYRHADIVHTEIPQAMQAALGKAIASIMPTTDMHNITVELADTAPSAMHLAVICDFAGSAAPLYPGLARLLQRTCAAVCQEHGWTMPLPQMVVHGPPPGSAFEQQLPAA